MYVLPATVRTNLMHSASFLRTFYIVAAPALGDFFEKHEATDKRAHKSIGKAASPRVSRSDFGQAA